MRPKTIIMPVEPSLWGHRGYGGLSEKIKTPKEKKVKSIAARSRAKPHQDLNNSREVEYALGLGRSGGLVVSN